MTALTITDEEKAALIAAIEMAVDMYSDVVKDLGRATHEDDRKVAEATNNRGKLLEGILDRLENDKRAEEVS